MSMKKVVKRVDDEVLKKLLIDNANTPHYDNGTLSLIGQTCFLCNPKPITMLKTWQFLSHASLASCCFYLLEIG